MAETLDKKVSQLPAAPGGLQLTDSLYLIRNIDGVWTSFQGNLQFSRVTLQGNTFNGLTELVQTDNTGNLPAIPGGKILVTDPTDNTQKQLNTALLNIYNGDAGVGTVTNVSGDALNGFTVNVTNQTTTPVITIGTSVNGIMFGNGTLTRAATSSDFPPIPNVLGGGANTVVYQSLANNTAFLTPVAGTILTCGIGGSGTTLSWLTTVSATHIADGFINDTEFNYLQGLTSNIQNQIDNINAGIVAFEANTLAIGNINISNPGTATFDGITLTNGQSLFLQAQTTSSQNGIYVFNGSSSALTRLPTMSTWDEVVGAQVILPPTTTYPSGSIWRSTVAASGTIGTTAITFVIMPNGALVAGVGVSITGNVIAIGQSVAIGSAPTFTGTNFTGIPNSATTATNANTAGAIVARDSSGNFIAGTITAALTGNASTATAIAGLVTNGILYQSAAGVTTNITPAASSVLVTNGSNVPSLSTTLPAVSSGATLVINPFTSSTTGLNTALSDIYTHAVGTGTVTNVLANNTNGFSWSIATSTTTPTITLSSTVNGLVKGDGTALSTAAAGIDYSAGTSSLATGILKSTATTGAITIAVAGDFPILNQNTTGDAGGITGGSTNQLLYQIAPGVTGFITNAASSVLVTDSSNVPSLSSTLPAVNSNATTVNNPFTLTTTSLSTALSDIYTHGIGTGTVTLVSVVTANGLTGSVATATTTPAITLGTTITGIVQGNGTAFSAATTTGSGAVVLANTPTLITPVLGVATATSLQLSSLTASQAVVTDSSKNLISMPYASIATASTLVQRDSNANSVFNNVIQNGNSVVSNGNSTVLTVASARLQILTGIANETYQLPDATTLTLYTQFEFNNNSSGLLTVVDAGTNVLANIISGGYAVFTVTSIGSANGVWDKHFLMPANASYGTAGMVVTGTFNASGNITGPTGLSTVMDPTTSLNGTLNTALSNVYTRAGSGITAISIASTNGFGGSSSGGTTPTLTLTTSVNGLLKGNGTGVSAATVTGTGDVVLATSPTLITASLGNSTANTQTAGDNSSKVATTAFVANAILGQNYKEACKYATTAALTSVYLNGTGGIGATLTGASVGVLTIDGGTPTVGNRILVKNQASSLENGIYVLTTAGSVSVAFILTRATDFNQSYEIYTGDATLVTSGNTLSLTTWSYNGNDNPSVGTDSLIFVQTAGQGSLTAGNGITITGNSIAIDTSITVDKTTAQTLMNKDLTSGTNTFPTFNQNTTGNAATATALASATAYSVPSYQATTSTTTFLTSTLTGGVLCFSNGSTNNPVVKLPADTCGFIGAALLPSGGGTLNSIPIFNASSMNPGLNNTKLSWNDTTTTMSVTSGTLTITGNVSGSAGSLSSTLAATSGGTGISAYTLGDTLYSSATNTLSKLAGNTTTGKQYLSQTGNGTISAAPSWSTISASDFAGVFQNYMLAGPAVSGTAAPTFRALVNQDIPTALSIQTLQLGSGPNVCSGEWKVNSNLYGQRKFFTITQGSSPYSIVNTDSRSCYINTGTSSEVTLNLPTPTAGLTYTAFVTNANGMKLVASTGVTIYIGASASSVAGYAESLTIGSSISLCAVNTTTWMATSAPGNWTLA